MPSETYILTQDDKTGTEFTVPAYGVFVVNAPNGNATLIRAVNKAGLVAEEVNWELSQDQIPDFGVNYLGVSIYQGHPQTNQNGNTDAPLFLRARYNDIEVTVITP